MNEMQYPAEIRKHRESDYVVRFPGLEGALTGAATLKDAEAEAADCLGSWLAQAMVDRRPIPAPRKPSRGQRTIPVPLWIAPKVALYQAMHRMNLSNSELGRRLGVGETVVRRMLDPDHATKLANLERVLRCAGVKLYLSIGIQDAA